MPGVNGNGGVFPFNLTGGVAGLVFGALAGLTAAHANRQTTLTWTAPNALAAGIVVFRMIEDDNTEAPGNPFKFMRLTPRPLGPTVTSFIDKKVLENRAYTYRLAAVDARGNFSAFTDVQIVTPQWVPQNSLSLWSEDFSKNALWTPAAGVTVTANAAGQGYLLAFTGANQALSTVVPVYPLNRSGGGVYTGGWEVKGNAGETITATLNGVQSGNAYAVTWQLTGGWDWIHLPRPVAAVGDRYLELAIGTTASATARNVSVRKTRVAAGALTAAQMQAGYEVTQGPGSTRQEPIEFRSDVPTYYNLMDQGYAGYHRSDDNNINPIILNYNVTKNLSMNGSVTVSRGAHHINTNYANSYNARVVDRNSRRFGLHPMADNVKRGDAYHCDQIARFDVQNCYYEHTGGIYLSVLRTDGNTDKVTFLRNSGYNTDGRYATAAGGYVQTPWGVNSNRPNGVQIAYELVSNLGIHGLASSAYTSAGLEIAYNEWYALPGMSRVEDPWNLSGMRGTAANPVRVHDNLVYCSWPDDYAWFKDANRLTRNYQIDRMGNPGEIYYDNWTAYNVYYSGSAGIPVDSNLHSPDPTVNGQYIEVYSNVNLGAAATLGLLDGQNVTVEQNRASATGNLPSGYLPNPVRAERATGLSAGFAGTSYYTGYATVSSISADRLTLTLSAALNLGGTQIPQAIGAKVYRRLGGVSNVNDAVNSILMGTVNAAAATGATTITLAAAAPAQLVAGDNLGYNDGYMSLNRLRRNIIESTQTSLGTLANLAIVSADNLFPGVPAEGREWELYGNWQATMAAAGLTAGPL